MVFRKAFDITKENIILAQPLVFYLVIISLTSAGLSQISNQTAFYIFFTANLLLSTAFFAGWMYMCAKTISHSKKEYKNLEEKSTASVKLISEFFPGVGEYFIPVTIAIALYTGFYALVLFAGYKIGLHVLPHTHLDWAKIMSAQTPEAMQKYLSTLSFAQLKAANMWFLFLGSIAGIYTFLTMFWFPAVIYDSKNPFTAFWYNLQFIFRNFLGSLGIIFYLFVLNMIVSVLNLFLNVNIILSIIGLVISFYFMTYCLVLIFLYYDEKRISNSDSGSDSIG